MPFYIIVKVKRKSLPSSLNFYLQQCGCHSSCREWSEHNLLYPLTKQSWGMIWYSYWAQHRCTCHHKLFLPLQTWTRGRSMVPVSRHMIHRDPDIPQRCLAIPVFLWCLSPWSSRMLGAAAIFFFFFLKENHKCGRKWLPVLWGLSWWGVADKLRTSQGKK